MNFRLNNKWPSGPENFNFKSLPPEFLFVEGIAPLPLTLNDSIGTEMVLLLFDRSDFITRLAATRPFALMMKTGLVKTAFGPLMFILFWVPDPANPREPVTAIDCHVNPFELQHMSTWRDLARQSHWHLFLIDAENQQQGFFEFENTYGLAESLDAVVQACEGMESIDFDLAKAEFCSRYDIPTLLAM